MKLTWDATLDDFNHFIGFWGYAREVWQDVVDKGKKDEAELLANEATFKTPTDVNDFVAFTLPDLLWGDEDEDEEEDAEFDPFDAMRELGVPACRIDSIKNWKFSSFVRELNGFTVGEIIHDKNGNAHTIAAIDAVDEIALVSVGERWTWSSLMYLDK